MLERVSILTAVILIMSVAAAVGADGEEPSRSVDSGRKGTMKTRAVESAPLKGNRVRPSIRKLLIIGNSITRHGPKADIGWPHECGMAATSEENDFAHLTLEHINAAQPGITAELSIGRVSAEAQMRGFEHLLPTDADLVIIELGDNYRGAANVDEFEKPYAEMVAAFREAGVEHILCVGTWGNGKLDPFIEAAAEKHGATFVRIGHLFADPANRAVSEGHFTHNGVNWHPGDRGMKAIADALWAELGKLWGSQQ